MRFASLGSGSKGNATLVEVGETRLLIDCGFGLRETVRRLGLMGLEAGDITAILLTHEHGDHAKGAEVLWRRFGIPVYGSFGTLLAVGFDPLHDKGLRPIVLDRPFSIADVSILPVAVPHDAREPCQYLIHSATHTLGILTDLGMITPHVTQAYARCDALYLECNHDLDMLRAGPYPPSLKRRVGGNWGHLNNAQSAALLERIDCGPIQHLVMAHLSEQNNTEVLARAAIEPALGTTSGFSGSLHSANQAEGFDWLSIA